MKDGTHKDHEKNTQRPWKEHTKTMERTEMAGNGFQYKQSKIVST